MTELRQNFEARPLSTALGLLLTLYFMLLALGFVVATVTA